MSVMAILRQLRTRAAHGVPDVYARLEMSFFASEKLTLFRTQTCLVFDIAQEGEKKDGVSLSAP
jgi:hypothetical protein